MKQLWIIFTKKMDWAERLWVVFLALAAGVAVLMLVTAVLDLSGCSNHISGHMYWDKVNQQDLICESTQEVLGGVKTWDGGKTWIIKDHGLSWKTYAGKEIAMQHAESLLSRYCP
jgi:hypothetical protein